MEEEEEEEAETESWPHSSAWSDLVWSELEAEEKPGHVGRSSRAD